MVYREAPEPEHFNKDRDREKSEAVISHNIEFLNSSEVRVRLGAKTIRDYTPERGTVKSIMVAVDNSVGEIKGVLGYSEKIPTGSTRIRVEFRNFNFILIGKDGGSSSKTEPTDNNNYLYSFSDPGEFVLPEARENLDKTKALYNIGLATSWKSLERALKMTGTVTLPDNQQITPEQLILWIDEAREGKRNLVSIPKIFGIYDKMIELMSKGIEM